MHFYITGDTHGNFNRIEEFCSENDTTKEDVMIILGDAGINYWLDNTDRQLKNDLSSLDITLFLHLPYLIIRYHYFLPLFYNLYSILCHSLN